VLTGEPVVRGVDQGEAPLQRDGAFAQVAALVVRAKEFAADGAHQRRHAQVRRHRAQVAHRRANARSCPGLDSALKHVNFQLTHIISQTENPKVTLFTLI